MAGQGMAGGPSEAELEQMLAQMREAPVEQVLVEVVNVLLQAGQVKLGRPDARVLIDAVAALAQAAEGRADSALMAQVGQAVTQIRLAQVEAEGGTPSTGAPATGAPGHATPASEPTGTPPAPTQRPDTGGAQRSRLWTPGS